MRRGWRRRTRAVAGFWWDFVVGDDPWLAVGVAVALLAVAGLARSGRPAWWVLPVSMPVLLGWSATRAARRRERP